MKNGFQWMSGLALTLVVGCASDVELDDGQESAPLAQLAPTATETDAGAKASLPGFDPGAGTLLADLKTVEYHIPDGTKNKDWNPRDKPINVRRGMTLRLIDDDTKAAGGGHWVHSFSICPHSTKPIGKGYECKIPQSAKLGLQSGIFEHNIANAGGRIYLVVVQ